MRIDDTVEDTAVAEIRVRLRHDAVPEELRIDRFLAIMIDHVLARTPVNIHVEVRERRSSTPLPVDEAETGTRDQEESSSD